MILTKRKQGTIGFWKFFTTKEFNLKKLAHSCQAAIQFYVGHPKLKTKRNNYFRVVFDSNVFQRSKLIPKKPDTAPLNGNHGNIEPTHLIRCVVKTTRALFLSDQSTAHRTKSESARLRE